MPVNRWHHRLYVADLFAHDDDDLPPFEQLRDEIVRRIKSTRFFTATDRPLHLDDLVDELADAEDYDEFNAVWDAFYDYADTHRIWVETVAVRPLPETVEG